MRSKKDHTPGSNKRSVINYKSMVFEGSRFTSKYNTGLFHTLPQEMFIKTTQLVNYQDLSIFMQTCKFFYNDPAIRAIRADKPAGWIAAGTNHTIMYLNNNTLLLCGDNKSGQLGLGHYNNQNALIKLILKNIPEGITILKVIAGARHNLIHLSNDDVLVCGNNQSGQLGLGHYTNQKTFIKLTRNNIPEGVTIRDIIAGDYHTLLHLGNDDLLVCGDNEFGQLGLGLVRNQNTFIKLALKDIPKGVTISQVIAGANYTIIHLSNDDLLVSGDNMSGQLGLGHNNKQNRFIKLSLNDIPENVSIRQIVAGDRHTLILLSNNDCLVCGGNTSGQLGLGHNNSQNVFIKLTLEGIPEGVTIVQMVVGASHNVIQLSNNDLLVCGYNKLGQLGLGHDDNQNRFIKVTLKDIPDDVTIRKVIAVAYRTIVHLSNNDILVCGDNRFDQLGLGHTNAQHTFTSSLHFSHKFYPAEEITQDPMPVYGKNLFETQFESCNPIQ